MPGTLFVVATPIGNLEDISARALRILQQVSLIAAEDTRRTAQLLARYSIRTRTTSLHEHNESSKASQLIDRLTRGDSIALVSDAGTPTVSDPGQRLVRAAIHEGIRVEPVPGPSAALAALVGSGLSTESVTFLGFPPTRSKDRRAWFDALRSAARTIVFFEAPHRIRTTLHELLSRFGDRPIAVARELTKVHEEFLRGSISDVLTRLEQPRGEFTIVVEIGQMIEYEPAKPPSDEEMADEFGRLTAIQDLSRRQAVQHLARAHGLKARDVYSALERVKNSV